VLCCLLRLFSLSAILVSLPAQSAIGHLGFKRFHCYWVQIGIKVRVHHQCHNLLRGSIAQLHVSHASSRLKCVVVTVPLVFASCSRQALSGKPCLQIWFMGLYLVNLAFVLLVYAQSKAVPPWVLVLLCLSKRVHSIFLLRLFNDCWAMAFFYGAVAVLQRRQWLLGLLLFRYVFVSRSRMLLSRIPSCL
jgi:hypothetical protein